MENRTDRKFHFIKTLADSKTSSASSDFLDYWSCFSKLHKFEKKFALKLFFISILIFYDFTVVFQIFLLKLTWAIFIEQKQQDVLIRKKTNSFFYEAFIIFIVRSFVRKV